MGRAIHRGVFHPIVLSKGARRIPVGIQQAILFAGRSLGPCGSLRSSGIGANGISMV